MILVGEIRDRETAEIAIQAALTGHLVFSTLHTNDAAGAVTRLEDMGVEAFLIASAVIGIMAQRLVRRVCPDCARARRRPTRRCCARSAPTRDRRGGYRAAPAATPAAAPASAGASASSSCCRSRTRSAASSWRARAPGRSARRRSAPGCARCAGTALEKAAQGLTTSAEVLRVTQEE